MTKTRQSTEEAEKALQACFNAPDLLVITGSRLAGTNRPDSDYDIKGVVLPPWEYLALGLDFDTYKVQDTDTTYFSLQHFVKLLSGCSPQQIEMLYATDTQLVEHSKIGDQLIQYRDKFRSPLFCLRVLGYARTAWDDAITRKPNSFGRISLEITAHGYAVTTVANLYRTLRQAQEYIESGTMTFPRSADEIDNIQQIKSGKVPYHLAKIIIDREIENFQILTNKAFPNGNLTPVPPTDIWDWYRRTVAKALIKDQRLQKAANE